MANETTSHPICITACRFYRPGFIETHPVEVRTPPACEHPKRPIGGLDVVRGEEREDCPLRELASAPTNR